MTENNMLSWVEVNGFMDDEFRKLVVSDALSFLPHASPALRKYATEILKKTIHVNGFRPYPNIPINIVKPRVLAEFQTNASVSTAIICLWGEQHRAIIQKLQEAALAANIPVHKEWGWEEAKHGFHAFDDIAPLDNLVEEMSGEEKPRQDHTRLAALWLSAGLFVEEKEIEYVDSPLTKPSAQPEKYEYGKVDPKGERVSRAIESVAQEDQSNEEDDEVSSIMIAELDRKNIQELSDYWKTRSEEIISAQDVFLKKIEELRASALGDTSEVMDKIKQLEDDRRQWEILKKQSEDLNEYIHSRILRELRARPDIKHVQPEVGALSEEPSAEELQAVLPAIFQAIKIYDKKKSDAYAELNNLIEKAILLEARLGFWQVEVLESDIPHFNDSLQGGSLRELQELISQHEKKIQNMLVRIERARELARIRILEALNSPAFAQDKNIEIGGYAVGMISQISFSELDDQELKKLEVETSSRLIDFNAAKKQNRRIIEEVDELQTNWENEAFQNLLQDLEVEQRDLEILFLTLSNAEARKEKINIPAGVASCLLRGLAHLSSPERPFDLLASMSGKFFQAWYCNDPSIKAQRCILALAAKHASPAALPEEFLWQVEDEWPVKELKNWDRLWQSKILAEPIEIYSDHKDAELIANLDKQQKNLENLLARDGGHYMRLGSLQSNRHRVMLGNRLLPHMDDQVAKLLAVRKELEEAPNYQHAGTLEKMRRYIKQLREELAVEKLEERYEKGIHMDGIDDDVPFHRRISLKILGEIADAILDFASTMLAYEDLIAARSQGLSTFELEEDLAILDNKTPLINLALLQISSMPALKNTLESGKSRLNADQIIAQAILTSPEKFSALPNFAGLICKDRLDWAVISKVILSDIKFRTETPNVGTVANVLLNKGAPDQVLLLAASIPLEQQRNAQDLQTDKRRQFEGLTTEFIQLGGEIGLYDRDRDLGRWDLINKEIRLEIGDLRRKTELERQAFEDRSLEFRVRINKMDESIFRIKAQIPQASFLAIQRGLTAARRASEDMRLFQPLQEYLDEIDYRALHNSWSEKEIENATSALEKNLRGDRVDGMIKMKSEQLLEYFGQANYDMLNIAPDDLPESAVNTRTNILEAWIGIRQMQEFLTVKMLRIDTERVKAFFSYFAQMVAMRRSKLTDGTIITDYENPILHSSWELQYPKTASLAGACFMIAIPGNPPSRETLKILDNFLDEQEFLGKDFVFLFIPGCNENIKKRLRQNYARKKLVVIDESTMFSILLAERTGRIPLAVLRPLMLNSTDANASIFDVNRSVNNRTSIFVGRDALVDRIASSGDNFALYGGRRIGKSSVIKAVEERLKRKNVRVISYSLEGEKTYTEDYVANKIAQIMGVKQELEDTGELKMALMKHLEQNPEEKMVILLDEIDRYILENAQRHALIEALRASSDAFGNRFRVIIVGFMALYDCLQGRGPYTPTSDPWRRMLVDNGPLDNLRSASAEGIVKEGFEAILGWEFEHRAIPQRIVMRTGGHPAFVQYFCLKIQEEVMKRGDGKIRLSDVENVYADQDPSSSFIAYVRKTLEMNLNPVSRYLILWLASDSSGAKGFTFDEIRHISGTTRQGKEGIPEELLRRSLEFLTVTSVVRERSAQVYEFTVPDYPEILSRLGETSHLEKLEEELDKYIQEYNHARK